jgi:uncharacterized protein (TIGR00255 family)
MNTIYSMTGFASVHGTVQSPSREQSGFTLAIKSVNHRFLDLQFRLPPLCDGLELQMRRVLKEQLRRGHVEVTLQVDRKATGQMQLNTDLLEAYVAAYREAAGLHGVSAEPDLNTMLRIPGVMSAETGFNRDDATALEGSVLLELEPLLEKLNEVRAQEGEDLAEVLRGSMKKLHGLAEEVGKLREGVRDGHFERLRVRMTELLNGAMVSDERLLSEAALLAEKSDIDEEVVRLRTHVERFVTMLDEGGELGKRTDFLLQEMNREANTMLSKTSSATGENGLRITELGLEMKAEIERAREQVQNLE